MLSPDNCGYGQGGELLLRGINYVCLVARKYDLFTNNLFSAVQHSTNIMELGSWVASWGSPSWAIVKFGWTSQLTINIHIKVSQSKDIYTLANILMMLYDVKMIFKYVKWTSNAYYENSQKGLCDLVKHGQQVLRNFILFHNFPLYKFKAWLFRAAGCHPISLFLPIQSNFQSHYKVELGDNIHEVQVNFWHTRHHAWPPNLKWQPP